MDASLPPAEEKPTVTDVVEEAGLDAATLAVRRAQLELAERAPEVKRTASTLALVAVCAVAVLTAFVFGNWALASALSSPLPGWRAPLVLAAAWLVVAALIAAVVARRERLPVRNWVRESVADHAETMRRRRDALEDAEAELKDTLGRLAEAVGDAAEERIAAAILPLAGGMVEVGEGMVEATDDVLDAADEITDVIEDRVPGGVVVNRAFDVALAPGRLGVRVARRTLKFGRDET